MKKGAVLGPFFITGYSKQPDNKSFFSLFFWAGPKDKTKTETLKFLKIEKLKN